MEQADDPAELLKALTAQLLGAPKQLETASVPWSLPIPTIALVGSIRPDIASLIESAAETFNCNVRRYERPADALMAGHYRHGKDNIAYAFSNGELADEWGGREHVPFPILVLDEHPGSDTPGISFLGRGLKGGSLTYISYGEHSDVLQLAALIEDQVREEDPRRKWSDSEFSEHNYLVREINYFAVSVLGVSDSEVKFSVHSIGSKIGGYAHAVEIFKIRPKGDLSPRIHRLSLESTRRVPLDPADEYAEHLAGPTQHREIGWTSATVSLPPGLWKAIVDGGGYRVRLIGEVTFTMPLQTQQKIFLSYVHEDSNVVHELAGMLEGAGFAVWLDKTDLIGGQRWKSVIRRAIRDGAAMIACFSTAYFGRQRTYMNQELNWAIEEMALRPNDRTWFIPIRLDDAPIPDRGIGGGEQLGDIQAVDMFPDFKIGFERLVRALAATTDRIR